jgi:hypothetical protein
VHVRRVQGLVFSSSSRYLGEEFGFPSVPAVTGRNTSVVDGALVHDGAASHARGQLVLGRPR